MLEIDNLHARVGDTPILKGLTLTLRPGEVAAIMGPNGSGKSTLSYVLSGRPGYEVTEGTVRFDGTYELLVTTLLPEGELNPAQALAKAVDAAGGVTLFGNLAEGSVDYRLPPADALLAAVQAQGVLETLATASGELGAELRDLLKKSKSK